MAKRSRQSFLKRQRERQRAEKAAEKRAKRLARRGGVVVEETEPEPTPGGLFGGEPRQPTAGEPRPESEQPDAEDALADRRH